MKKHVSFTPALLLLLACGKPSAEPARGEAAAPALAHGAATDAAHAEAAPAAPSPTAAPAAIAPEVHHGLAWYADAAEPALASVRGTDKLLLVDLWAAWCHTCLSMRAHVLTADNLAPVRDRLAFLALDTEQRGNAALLEQLPIGAWPTFYLLDADKNVYGRWVGAASPAQLVAFVRDGLSAYDQEKSGSLPADHPLARLIAGDRLAARGQLAEARVAYERALAVAPPHWPRRPDVLVALASNLRKLGDHAACLSLAERDIARAGDAASATDFVVNVLGCADAHAKTAEPAASARGGAPTKLLRALERKLASLCDHGSAQLTPDDRGDACGVLHDLREKRGDARGARAASTRRLALLSAAAEGLPDAVAQTYDFARAESLVQLGRSDEAIALLSARARALPDDYSPRHFLARTYRDLGRFAEALPEVERALEKSAGQGPRQAAILGVKADVLLGLGRSDEARAVVAQQLAAYRALPKGQQQPARAAGVAERLASWK